MTSAIYVRKWDKSREAYDRGKVVKALQRYGFTGKEVDVLLSRIEAQLYNGITTKKLLQLISNEADSINFTFKKNDLRTALGLMRSKPDFEIFVQELLRGLGYKVSTNKVIQGYCVTHEIDGVAERDGKLYYIETKHHSKTHIRTLFGDSLAVKAKLDDIRHGYSEGKNDYDFEGAILICNTKMTQHADDYSRCVGIKHIGWNSPSGNGIDVLIEKSGVYPFTILPGLSKQEIRKLQSLNVVTVKDVIKLKSSSLGESRLSELKALANQLID